MFDSIIAFIIAVVIVVVLAKVFFKSTGFVIGFLVNALIGAVVLWILDVVGLGVPITWLTSAIVGFLGVPGVIIVVILKYVFKIF